MPPKKKKTTAKGKNNKYNLTPNARSYNRFAYGKGDYTISNYNKMDKIPKNSVPVFTSKNRECIVTHKEFITDITSSGVTGAFKNDVLPVNPGLASSYPWLSGIAGNYEEYEILGQIYAYVPMSGNSVSSNNASLGYFGMAAQYNVNQPAFTNKQQVMNYDYSVSTIPSRSCLLAIECKRKDTSFGSIYNTRNTTMGNDEKRLYDIANLNLISEGYPAANAKLGSIIATYKIRLLKPKMNMTKGISNAFSFGDHFSSNGSGASTSAYFGSAIPSATSTSNLGCILTNTTVTIPSFFIGNICFIYCLVGSSTANVGITVAGSAGASDLDVCLQNTASKYSISATSATMYGVYFFKCTGGGTLTLSAGTLVTSPIHLDVYILGMPFNN